MSLGEVQDMDKLKGNEKMKRKYYITYENGDIAGFTDTNQLEEDLYLWRDGTKWNEAIFDDIRDAKAVIKATNEFKKKKGWKQNKFKIVKE